MCAGKWEKWARHQEQHPQPKQRLKTVQQLLNSVWSSLFMWTSGTCVYLTVFGFLSCNVFITTTLSARCQHMSKVKVTRDKKRRSAALFFRSGALRRGPRRPVMQLCCGKISACCLVCQCCHCCCCWSFDQQQIFSLHRFFCFLIASRHINNSMSLHWQHQYHVKGNTERPEWQDTITD